MPVTAIEVRLEPDQTMIAWAAAVKTQLLAHVSTDFAVDALPAPCVTLLQQSVRTARLDTVCSAIEDVLIDANNCSYKIAAHKYQYTVDLPITLRAILVKATPQLLWLRKRVTDAISSHSEWSGATNAPTPLLERALPERASKRLRPAAVESMSDLDELLAATAKPFVFAPSLASIYRIGTADEDGELLMAIAVASRSGTRQVESAERVRRFG